MIKLNDNKGGRKMRTLQAIKAIQKSNASDNIKDCLCHVASEFDCFLQLKCKYKTKGLLKACYKEFGLKFLGMYGINTLEDLIIKANHNSLLY